MTNLYKFSVVILTMLIAGCTHGGRFNIQKKIFPEIIHHFHFGMPMDEVKAMLPDYSEVGNDSFRKVYMQTLLDHPSINNVVYYFDDEGKHPLYEFIINYNSESLLKEEANKLLGKPNHKDKEWKFDSGLGYPIHAWRYQNKLIIVGVLPGTEWYGEDL